MLLIPLALGSLAARAVSASALLILPATALLFLGRFAAIPGGTRTRSSAVGGATPEMRRLLWTGVYLGASVLGLGLAVWLAPASRRTEALSLVFLIGVLGAANAGLVLSGKGRTLGAESFAMAALATTASLVMVLVGEPLDGRTIGIGLMCLCYFLSSIAFVRAFRVLGEGRARRSVITACLGVHVLLAGSLIVLWRIGWLPVGLLFAFVPVLGRTAWGLARPAPNVRALGWRELVVAATFLIIAGTTFLAS
jgi:hypothetical protein